MADETKLPGIETCEAIARDSLMLVNLRYAQDGSLDIEATAKASVLVTGIKIEGGQP